MDERAGGRADGQRADSRASGGIRWTSGWTDAGTPAADRPSTVEESFVYSYVFVMRIDSNTANAPPPTQRLRSEVSSSSPPPPPPPHLGTPTDPEFCTNSVELARPLPASRAMISDRGRSRTLRIIISFRPLISARLNLFHLFRLRERVACARDEAYMGEMATSVRFR